MSDPLALLPYALAAADGTITHGARRVAVRAAVAAGLTLLQRGPGLVRALGANPVTVCLPGDVAWITGLAFADGRGLMWVHPSVAAAMPALVAQHHARVLVTTSALAALAPEGITLVLLDDVPRRAQLRGPSGTTSVDLGSHVGLALEGDPDVMGRDERCLWVDGTWHSHRALLEGARAAHARPDTLSTATGALRTLLPWLGALLAGETVSALD